MTVARSGELTITTESASRLPRWNAYGPNKYEFIKGRLYVGKNAKPSELKDLVEKHGFKLVVRVKELSPKEIQSEAVFTQEYGYTSFTLPMSTHPPSKTEGFDLNVIEEASRDVIKHMFLYPKDKVLVQCHGGHGRSFMIGLIIRALFDGVEVAELLTPDSLKAIVDTRSPEAYFGELPEYPVQSTTADVVVRRMRDWFNSTFARLPKSEDDDTLTSGRVYIYSSANSMVRKCSSVGPHKCDRRVLLCGVKVWRRIKSIIS